MGCHHSKSVAVSETSSKNILENQTETQLLELKLSLSMKQLEREMLQRCCNIQKKEFDSLGSYKIKGKISGAELSVSIRSIIHFFPALLKIHQFYNKLLPDNTFDVIDRNLVDYYNDWEEQETILNGYNYEYYQELHYISVNNISFIDLVYFECFLRKTYEVHVETSYGGNAHYISRLLYHFASLIDRCPVDSPYLRLRSISDEIKSQVKTAIMLLALSGSSKQGNSALFCMDIIDTISEYMTPRPIPMGLFTNYVKNILDNEAEVFEMQQRR